MYKTNILILYAESKWWSKRRFGMKKHGSQKALKGNLHIYILLRYISLKMLSIQEWLQSETHLYYMSTQHFNIIILKIYMTGESQRHNFVLSKHYFQNWQLSWKHLDNHTSPIKPMLRITISVFLLKENCQGGPTSRKINRPVKMEHSSLC